MYSTNADAHEASRGVAQSLSGRQSLFELYSMSEAIFQYGSGPILFEVDASNLSINSNSSSHHTSDRAAHPITIHNPAAALPDAMLSGGASKTYRPQGPRTDLLRA